MANLVVVLEDIGSAGGRDFSTLAAYIAALPNPFPANTIRLGQVRADSDFDEKDVLVRPVNRPTDSPNLMVHGIPGETPTFKPASGSATRILFIDRDMSLTGLTVDGTNLTGGSQRGFETNGFNDPVVGCAAKNMAGSGFFGGGNGTAFWIYCLAENCLFGIGADLSTANAQALGCGAAICGTGFQGRNATNTLRLNACWALSSTTADIGSFIGAAEFLYISDASIGAGDDRFLNQVPANLGFVNFAGGDYRLAAGSSLIAKGLPIWNLKHRIATTQDYFQWGIQDAFGQAIRLDYGTRMNIGPFQPSGVEALPTTPGINFVSIP